jgi:hypothetical protein
MEKPDKRILKSITIETERYKYPRFRGNPKK